MKWRWCYDGRLCNAPAFHFGLFDRMCGNGNVIYCVNIQREGRLYQSQMPGEKNVEQILNGCSSGQFSVRQTGFLDFIRTAQYTTG